MKTFFVVTLDTKIESRTREPSQRLFSKTIYFTDAGEQCSGSGEVLDAPEFSINRDQIYLVEGQDLVQPGTPDRGGWLKTARRLGEMRYRSARLLYFFTASSEEAGQMIVFLEIGILLGSGIAGLQEQYRTDPVYP